MLLAEIIKDKGGEILLMSKDSKKVLGRFPYGKDKEYKDKEAAKMAAEKREGQVQAFKHKESDDLAEALSLGERQRIVGSVFRQNYQPRDDDMRSMRGFEETPRILEIYDDYLVAIRNAYKYRVGFTMDAQGNVTFNPSSMEEWPRAQMEVRTVESDETPLQGHILGEHFPLMMQLGDAELSEAMEADIVLIEPGFGNPRDNHFYPKDVIRRDAGGAKGVKMFATNHKEGEHNTRNWVATIIDAGQRFLPSGAAVARIAVHKKDFWEDLKGLESHGLLSNMHNSILATGKAKEGYIEGKPANIVEKISNYKAVDFVNKAGAGGHVLKLVEQFTEAGDIDIITVDSLKERRPDLFEEIQQDAIESYAEEQTSETNSKEATMPEKDEAVQAQVDAVKKELKEEQERNAKLSEQLAEMNEQDVRTKAVQYLLLSEQAKRLPKPSLARIREMLEDEANEIEEGAKVEDVVEALITTEVKYLKDLSPSLATGLGKAFTESDDDDDTNNGKHKTTDLTEADYEERQKKTDAAISQYLGRPAVAKEAQNAV